MTQTPLPPENLWTITPHRRPRTVDEVIQKYDWTRLAGRDLFDELRRDLADLRALDAHVRSTDPSREEAKRALRRRLDKEL